MNTPNCQCKIQLILTEEELADIVHALSEAHKNMKEIGLDDVARRMEKLYEELKNK